MTPARSLTRTLPRRMWISAGQQVPLIVLTMGGWSDAGARLIGNQMASYLEFVLPRPIVLWAAIAVLPSAVGFGREPLAQHVDTHQSLALVRAYPLFDLCDPSCRPLPEQIAWGTASAHISKRGGDHKHWYFVAGAGNCARVTHRRREIRALSISRPRPPRILRMELNTTRRWKNLWRRTSARAPGDAVPVRRETSDRRRRPA